MNKKEIYRQVATTRDAGPNFFRGGRERHLSKLTFRTKKLNNLILHFWDGTKKIKKTLN